MTVAWPTPAIAPITDESHSDIPLEALLIGAAVPAVVASVAWWLGVPWVAGVAAIGVPIGAVLAIVASRRLAGSDWLATSIMLGLGAPLIPGVCIGLVFAAGGLLAIADGGFGAVAGGLALGAITLVVALVGGVPVTLPTALVAGFLVRRAATMSPSRRRRHMAAFGIVAGVVAIPTLSVAVAGADGGLGAGPVDWAIVGGEVPITLTVENHTRQERMIDISWPAGDGATNGWAMGIDPCTTVTDRSFAGNRSWTISQADIGDQGDLAPGGPPIASGADWPDADPSLTIVFERDGQTSVRAGSRVPSGDEGHLDEPVAATPCG